MPLWRMILTAVNLVGFRLGGAAIGLISQILLARLLPQADVGVIFMAMSAAALISLLMAAGYPSLAMTYLPRYYALGRHNLVRAFYAALWHDTTIMTIVVAVVVALVVFFGPLGSGVNTALVFGCLTAPASALIRITSSTANSLRRFSLSYVPDFLFRPGMLMAYLVIAWASGWALPVTSVLWALVAVTALVAVGQALVLGREGPFPYFFARTKHHLAPLMRGRAASLVIVGAISASFADIVTLIGGLFLEVNDVAQLGVAIRLAALAGFVTQATQQFILPDLTAAITRKVRRDVESLLFRINLIALSAIAVCVLGAIFFGPLILGIFGDQYASAHWPLVLFMISQLFRAAGGMNQYLLSIDGFQGRTANSYIFAVAALAASASLLTPAFGVLGMAFAVVIADFLWAAVLGVQAQRYAGYRGDILAVLRFQR